jgi:transcriptional regulator with XRE-family HTH domain
MKKNPHPVDQHVGGRVRMRRILVGMSQEKLGEALGLTFQQVQKYEKGSNRIGASRLQQIALTLDVSPAFFFEGQTPSEAGAVGGEADAQASRIVAFLASADGLSLNRAFARIRDPRLRRRIIDLVVAIANGAD